MDTRILGDFTLLNKLGDGTLGATYLAEHRFIKKRFLVKILPPELSDDSDFIRRFEEYIATLASLEHPNIAQVHNVSHADGVYFVVSEALVSPAGVAPNIGAYLKQSKHNLTESGIAALVQQVGSALDYAHKKKCGGHPLAHRGIKLNNILIQEKSGQPSAQLTDFGLANVVGEAQILTAMYRHLAEQIGVDDSVASSLATSAPLYFNGGFDPSKLSSLHFSFYQNYAFLAPEQRFFRDGSVGVQSDIYALGILAYFLIMRAFPEGFFALPSQARKDLAMDWDGFIEACLQPNPAKRPQTPAQALEIIKAAKKPARQPAEYTKPKSAPQVYPYTPPEQPAGKASTQSAIHRVSPDEQQEIQQHVTAVAAPEEKEQEEVRRDTEPASYTSQPDEEMISSVSQMIQPTEAPKPVIKPGEILRPIYDPDPGKVFQMETTVARYKPKEKKVENVEPILTDMIVVQGGEFSRGSNGGVRDERPLHKVWLSDFALDIHSVSNEQFVRFLEAMGGEKDANNNDIIKLRESRIKRISGKYTIESGYAKHPVIGITWYGAAAYAKWIGKRLPTEAEFEIASRGGLDDAIYPTGEDIDRSQANFFGADTTPVMSYPPNNYGLFDMVGNVYEWCLDWYGYDYYEDSKQEPENPQGPAQGVYRVLRGGCWKSLKEDLRCAHRHRNNPATVNTTYGFRCAADVTH